MYKYIATIVEISNNNEYYIESDEFYLIKDCKDYFKEFIKDIKNSSEYKENNYRLYIYKLYRKIKCI
jgi:phage anti-repressor protein